MITYGYCYLLVIPYYSLKAIFLCRIICTNFTNSDQLHQPLLMLQKSQTANHLTRMVKQNILVKNGNKKTTNQPFNLNLVKAGGPFRNQGIAKWQELATKLSPKTGPWSRWGSSVPGGTVMNEKFQVSGAVGSHVGYLLSSFFFLQSVVLQFISVVVSQGNNKQLHQLSCRHSCQKHHLQL